MALPAPRERRGIQRTCGSWKEYSQSFTGQNICSHSHLGMVYQVWACVLVRVLQRSKTMGYIRRDRFIVRDWLV